MNRQTTSAGATSEAAAPSSPAAVSPSAAGLDRRWATHLVCSRTGETAPLDRPAFLSPAGAPWLVEHALDPARGESLRRALPGRPWTLWRYRELLPVANYEGRVDLGEGATPLVRLRRMRFAGAEVWIKDESGNPTGSFKARGLSLAVNRARELGAPGVELASAGNAALALAAYAAAAGLPARVALPADTPPAIAARCRDHGAEVLSGQGTLVEAARLLAAAGAAGEAFWNLSTLREPYRVEGKKTMGLELAEQLGWELPDWIFYPLGGGTGIVGMDKAFAELRRLGLAGEKRPRFVAVQMAGCAPIVRAFARGLEAAETWEEPRTRVWGLRVPRAIGDFLVLRALRESAGRAVAVDEARLPEVAASAAREEGLRIGPEGAAALAAALDLAAAGAFAPGERVVVFQTGDPANYQ
ncbi:MAG TPA: threonine synthase [Thermoanaerobaculia bacterium]|nr:threonine synthase [Thermoanaerobaculia bacterium]